MLVLSRNKDESIIVGNNVEIMILGIRGKKVDLGITAPRYIPIHRKEIYTAIQQERVHRARKTVLVS